MNPTQTWTSKPVTVVFGRHQVMEQPATFRICPLGLQFYSPKLMREFEIVEFSLRLPGGRNGREPVHASGVVVHCRPEKDRRAYRVWIKFLDLPASKRKKLECFARSAETLCPYCENF